MVQGKRNSSEFLDLSPTVKDSERTQVCEIFVNLGLKVAAPKNLEEAIAHLARNPLAKVVIVVDTHSTQDGQLVYHTTSQGVVYSDYLGAVCASS